jgi:hypothetical protein
VTYIGNPCYVTGDPPLHGGARRPDDRAQKVGIHADRERVAKFMRAQVAYELHKPARRRFVRNQTLVSHIDEQWLFWLFGHEQH